MAELPILFFGSLLAGLSVLVFKPSERLFKMLLAFGGAFLLGLTFFHLLPAAYDEVGSSIGVAVVAGFLFQVILESVSGGIEHGHHHHASGKFPVTVFVGLSLHAFLEGLPFGHHHHHDSDAWPLLIGVMLHKMPVAFVLGTMLLTGEVGRTRLIGAILAFSLMAPLGMLGMELFQDVETSTYYGIIGFVVGMLLHISTTILYEADKGHRFNLLKLSVIVVALATSYLVSLF